MAAQRIQIGQMWKKIDTGEIFLVTKLYHEALSTIAVLRPAEEATAARHRVRVERRGNNQTLPGFVLAHGNDNA